MNSSSRGSRGCEDAKVIGPTRGQIQGGQATALAEEWASAQNPVYCQTSVADWGPRTGPLDDKEPQDHSDDLTHSTEDPPPSRGWEADSHLSKAFSFVLGLPAAPSPLVLPTHTLSSHRKERRLRRDGVHCGSQKPPSSSEHQGCARALHVPQAEQWAPRPILQLPAGNSLAAWAFHATSLLLTAAHEASQLPEVLSPVPRVGFPATGSVCKGRWSRAVGTLWGPWDAGGSVTWALVQLPGLSDVSLAEPHALANGWPDAAVVVAGEDGV